MAGIIKTDKGYQYIDRAGNVDKQVFATKSEAKTALPDLYQKEKDVNPGGNPKIGEKVVKKTAKKVAKKVTKKKN